MIIALWIVIAVLIFFILGILAHIGKLQKELAQIDKEQHSQNMDIIDAIKFKGEATQMLIQHVEILKYLVEQDETLGKKKVYYTGPVGEA